MDQYVERFKWAQARLREAQAQARRTEQALLAQRAWVINEALASGPNAAEIAAQLGVSRARLYAMRDQGRPAVGTPQAPALSRDTRITLGVEPDGGQIALERETTWGALVDQGDALHSLDPVAGQLRRAWEQRRDAGASWTVADAIREQVLIHDSDSPWGLARLAGWGPALGDIWHVVTAEDIEAALGHGTRVHAA